MTRHKRHGIKLRSMYNWHRYLGGSVALFVVVLSVTGLMLNHSNELALDKRYVENPSLLNWYGITAPEQIPAFPLGHHWISQWEQQVYLDEDPLSISQTSLRGAVHTDDYLVIASQSELWLLTPEGELVEKMTSAHGLPTPIEQLGIAIDKGIVVQTQQGIYRADVELLNWRPFASAQIHWSRIKTLPYQLHTGLAAKYRGHDLPWERVLLDMHSGRILGPYGIFIMDAAAIIFLLLAASGLWIWSVRIYKQRQHRK